MDFVNIEDEVSKKAVVAFLDTLKLEYDIDEYGDETERVNANPYLSEKLTQGKKDMQNDKGTSISVDDLWK
jgi:methyl coenzyme M reductase subunit C-like uncharacterized protein (methanogenesis marker protein 7)